MGFDVQRETVFHFHGWSEIPSASELSFFLLGTAFLQRNSSNIVFFDYSKLVQNNNQTGYTDSVNNASYIGNAIGQYWQQYIPTVQSIEYLHLTSFSLGSQIMSTSARIYGAGLFKWLTAMDPAGPIYNIPGVKHLTKDDAEFVDVVHTDAGVLGDDRSDGSVDFFPNRGTRVQPYCITNTTTACHHRMSFIYYAEALMNPTAFAGKKCSRTEFCSPCTCSIFNGEYTYIGYSVNKSARGNFYMDTNAQSPFGKGMSGMDNYVI